MLVYANDYHGVLPRAGGPASTWKGPVIWNAVDANTAYGVSTGEGRATISSCLYLLVKYLQVPPRMFVCPADERTKEFGIAEETGVPADFRLTDAWEFGTHPTNKCSYAYHLPFGQYGLTTSRDPNLVVAADRNPWIVSPAADAGVFNAFIPDVAPYSGTVETARMGNAVSHHTDGQNVLFLDGRVTFENRSFCGLDNDNIYTRSTNVSEGDALGTCAVYSSTYRPLNGRDTLLVHDPIDFYHPRTR